MSEPVGFDFNETLDFLNVLQDSVPSLQNESRDPYASTFLDTQLMSYNLDCSPEESSPGDSNNLFFATDSSPSYQAPASQDPSSHISLMTDDATFLNEFSNIHSGSKADRKSVNSHSPLTPHSSSKNSTYDQTQNMYRIDSMPNLSVTTPQSNPLRGGSSLSSTNAPKSPVEDLFPKSDSAIKEEPRIPKVISSKRKVTKAPKKLKISHNVIEKKYRTNINTKILELRDVVPSLRIMSSSQSMSVADLEGLEPASKLNKASVLTKATEYIKHLEIKHDALDNKIAELQNMIGQSPTGSIDARMPMPDSMGNVPPTSDQSTMPTHRGQGFYNAAPVNVQYANQSSEPASYAQNCGISNGNLFMGGFATLLGANYVSEDNFRGMAAIPFLPARMAVIPSAQSLLIIKNFMMFMGGLSVVAALYNVISPRMFRLFDKRSSQFTLQNLKFQPLEDSDRQFVLDHVSGVRKGTFYSLMQCYGILITKEKTFDNSFLLLLVCALLSAKASVVSRLLTLVANIKTQNFNTLPYNGENEGLTNLNKLMRNMDGLNLFQCKSTIQRLSNISSQQVVNHNVRLVDYSHDYVDVYLRNKKDFFSIVFGWRVMSIIFKLNLSLLDTLATPQERREDKMRQFMFDLSKLEDLLGKNSKMNTYLYSLQMITRPNEAPQILKTVDQQITNKLNSVSQLFEDRDVTDGEMSDSETEDQDEPDEKPPFDVMRENKSLLSTMNLVNEEKFIAITASLAIHSLQKQEKDKKDEEVLRLLQFLSFSEARSLSLLSFTALVHLMTQLIGADVEQPGDSDAEAVQVRLDTSMSLALELLLKMMRTWLKDEAGSQVLSQTLRVDLTEIVMTRALVLNKL